MVHWFKTCRACSSKNFKHQSVVFKDGTLHIYRICLDCLARYNVKPEYVEPHQIRDLPLLTSKEAKEEYKLLKKPKVPDLQESLF